MTDERREFVCIQGGGCATSDSRDSGIWTTPAVQLHTHLGGTVTVCRPENLWVSGDPLCARFINTFVTHWTQN